VSEVDPERVAYVVAEGDGNWVSCTGCYETEDGHPVGDYPHSPVFNCAVGGGCGECGGLGVVWDTTDWDDFTSWCLEQERTRETVRAALVGSLRVYEGRIIGIDDAVDAVMSLKVPAVASAEGSVA
jgi:hypothetical protein